MAFAGTLKDPTDAYHLALRYRKPKTQAVKFLDLASFPNEWFCTSTGRNCGSSL